MLPNPSNFQRPTASTYNTNGPRSSRPASSNNGTLDHLQTQNIQSDTSPERKLKSSLHAISEAFDEKVADLESQILSWKKTSSNLEKKNKELENTIEDLNSALSKKSRDLSSLSEKHRELLTSQDQLLEKYNQLRKYASKLQEFKKNICNLSGSTSVTIDADIIEQSLAIEDERLVPKLNGHKKTFHSSDQSSQFNPVRQNLDEFKRERKPSIVSHHSQKKNIPGEYLNQENVEDLYNNDETFERIPAEDVYDEILTGLNPSEFEQFARTIDDFNTKRISVPTALSKFQEIIHDKYLFDKMKDLLMTNASFITDTQTYEEAIDLGHPASKNQDLRQKYSARQG